MSLLLSLSLLIGLISSSSAVEVEVAAPPSGDEAAFIRAYDLSGALVAEAAHPASGEDGWSFLQEARDAGKIAAARQKSRSIFVTARLDGMR